MNIVRLLKVPRFPQLNFGRILTFIISVAISSIPSYGQTIINGSDGSDGALIVTTDTTLDMEPNHPDGIYNFTTIHVQPGATLRFNRNDLNTPVYLLASGDVTIDGQIDVSGGNGGDNRGLGGPGGFDGGNRGFMEFQAGAGFGPGGGEGGTAGSSTDRAGGHGAYRTPSSSSSKNGIPYGSPILVPLVGGSGGGGSSDNSSFGNYGSGGGGAILIASDTIITINRNGNNGRIRARGGTNIGLAGAGSGGAIRLVAPVVAGTGFLDINGGSSNAGHGRIRIDVIDWNAMQLTYSSPSSLSLGAFFVAIPDELPKLDIINVAGTSITEGSGAAVTVTLNLIGDPNPDPNRTVTVQARYGTGSLPIAVKLIPDSGQSVVYNDEIDFTGATGDEARSKAVDVTFPFNTPVTVQAWTR